MELTDAPGQVRVDPDRHRVHREVPAHQVVLEPVAEHHLGVAGHLVVAVGAERGDLDALAVLGRPDGPELDPGVPQRFCPAAQHLLQLGRSGVGGEVQVVQLAAQQRIAHTATHQIQVMTRRREHPAQVYEQTRMLVQRDRGSGQQS